MKYLRSILVFIFFVVSGFAKAQSCSEDSLIIFSIKAIDTDANIQNEFAKHFTYYNPDCTDNGILLVHLPGTSSSPMNYQLFPSLAANNGFHVLSLKYINSTSGQSACALSSDIDCHLKFRQEIIEGVDYSPEISVDSVNSIYNRLIRLLQYMDTNFPAQNWGQFFTGDSIHWSKVMISGHSQGGGHAAIIGINKPLKRVLMFASPNDYSNTYSQYAPWTSMPHLTEDSVYYSLNNLNDDFANFDWQYHCALNLGEAPFGDSTLVDGVNCPYNYAHNLYTNIDSSASIVNHSLMIYDNLVPLDGQNKPVFQETWEYMLGITCQPLDLDQTKTPTDLLIYPNPTPGKIHIKTQLPISEIAFFDLLGKNVSEQVIQRSAAEFDLSNLAPGTYILVISNQDVLKTLQIAVE